MAEQREGSGLRGVGRVIIRKGRAFSRQGPTVLRVMVGTGPGVAPGIARAAGSRTSSAPAGRGGIPLRVSVIGWGGGEARVAPWAPPVHDFAEPAGQGGAGLPWCGAGSDEPCGRLC